MSKEIYLLNDLSHALGIIGLVELQERLEIADWIFGNIQDRPDPRGPSHGGLEPGKPPNDEDVFRSMPVQRPLSANAIAETETQKPEAQVMQFLALKRWYFTIGDTDCAPSVPHGHENSKTQKWPKINPYTGKVFTSIHAEDTSRRLSREEMKAIWRNADFVEHCRKHVKWYSERFPDYMFVNARRGYLAFPRW